MQKTDRQTIREWIRELGRRAGEAEGFEESFFQRLTEDAEIEEEFIYYMKNGNFLCKWKIEEYTVVDIMVWQIDHFKAWLDREDAGMRENGSKMVLRAFDTMLKMKENPERYKELMQTETGTDYPDKYR